KAHGVEIEAGIAALAPDKGLPLLGKDPVFTDELPARAASSVEMRRRKEPVRVPRQCTYSGAGLERPCAWTRLPSPAAAPACPPRGSRPQNQTDRLRGRPQSLPSQPEYPRHQN